jgi:hypothetical protein
MVEPGENPYFRLSDPEEPDMPLFAAAITVARRRMREPATTNRATAPPLWRLLADEIVEAGRALRRRAGCTKTPHSRHTK